MIRLVVNSLLVLSIGYIKCKVKDKPTSQHLERGDTCDIIREGQCKCK